MVFLDLSEPVPATRALYRVVFQLQELTATIGFAVAIFGYNQAGGGSVLPDASFNKQFPKMDVIYTTGAQQHYNATIQGMSFPTSKYQTNLLIHTRHRNRPLHADRRVRRPRLYLRVRYMGPARHDLRRCRHQLCWRIVDVYLLLLWTIHRLTYYPRHRHGWHHCHCQRLAKWALQGIQSRRPRRSLRALLRLRARTCAVDRVRVQLCIWFLCMALPTSIPNGLVSHSYGVHFHAAREPAASHEAR